MLRLNRSYEHITVYKMVVDEFKGKDLPLPPGGRGSIFLSR